MQSVRAGARGGKGGPSGRAVRAMQTAELSDFFASLELGGGTDARGGDSPENGQGGGAEQPERAMQPEHVYLLDSEDILAHLQYLPEAFCFVKDRDGERLDYVLRVDGIERGSYLISFLPIAQMEHVVQVAPLDDVPDELRPSQIACTFMVTPVALLTLLAGGAADLRADSVPQMQQFLQAFRFTSYTAFCQRHGLQPYLLNDASSQEAAIAQVRRVANKVAGAASSAWSKSLHSVALATVAASDRARAKLIKARLAVEAGGVGDEAGNNATCAGMATTEATGTSTSSQSGRSRGFGLFRSPDPVQADGVVKNTLGDYLGTNNHDAMHVNSAKDLDTATSSREGQEGSSRMESTRKWLQGAQGAAAGWFSSTASKALSAVESARTAASGMGPSQGEAASGPDSDVPDFTFLFPRSARAASTGMQLDEGSDPGLFPQSQTPLDEELAVLVDASGTQRTEEGTAEQEGAETAVAPGAVAKTMSGEEAKAKETVAAKSEAAKAFEEAAAEKAAAKEAEDEEAAKRAKEEEGAQGAKRAAVAKETKEKEETSKTVEEEMVEEKGEAKAVEEEEEIAKAAGVAEEAAAADEAAGGEGGEAAKEAAAADEAAAEERTAAEEAAAEIDKDTAAAKPAEDEIVAKAAEETAAAAKESDEGTAFFSSLENSANVMDGNAGGIEATSSESLSRKHEAHDSLAGVSCASCGVLKTKEYFSGSQLKKGDDQRRCKECVYANTSV